MDTPKQIIHGIPSFATRNYYWGVIPQAEMAKAVNSMEVEGFDVVDARMWLNTKNNLYTHEWDRSDFLYMLPLSLTDRVLDVGSGYGTNAIPIAAYVKEVVAVDASIELLRYVHHRSRAMGRENVTCVHTDPFGTSPFPFEDSSFDVVVVSGILEWTPMGNPKKNPVEIQQAALKEVTRVLKPGGTMILVIENRWFFGFLQRDPHTKTPWVCWLPRQMANIVAKRQGLIDGYLPYIYGEDGTSQLLGSAGLSVISIFATHPNYRTPRFVYPSQSAMDRLLFRFGYGKRFFTKKWFMILQIWSFLFRSSKLIAGFWLVARSMGGDEQLESLLERLCREVDHPMPPGTLFWKEVNVLEDTITRYCAQTVSGDFFEIRIPRHAKGSITVTKILSI